MRKAQHIYQDVSLNSGLLTATPHQLIQKLLEGAISTLNLAVTHLEHNNISEKCLAVKKATDIIIGLRSALNIEQGKQIAQELEELYAFMLQHLLQANMTNKKEYFIDVIDMLTDIKQGWENLPDKWKVAQEVQSDQ